MTYLNFAKTRLQKNGYKLTTPRLFVLGVLEKSKKPLNAYEIVKKISAKKSTIEPSTAYRILEVYEKLDLVHFNKEVQGYTICQDWTCSNQKHCHHQFTCSRCEQITEFHIEDQNFLKTLKTKFKDFLIQSHYFEFSGLCKSCTKPQTK